MPIHFISFLNFTIILQCRFNFDLHFNMAASERTIKYIVVLFLVYFAINPTYCVTTVVDSLQAFQHGTFEVDGNNKYVLYELQKTPVYVFGSGLSNSTSISLSLKRGDYGADCNNDRISKPFTVTVLNSFQTVGKVDVLLPEGHTGEAFHICVSNSIDDNSTTYWVHQGTKSWGEIHSGKKSSTFLPMPIQIVILVLLLMCSGLFSGLNLGLMSLDKTELQIVANSGSPKEKKYAEKIKPLRKRGNYLLCTILLGNVLVNNSLTILLDNLIGSGIAAIIGSTFFIVVFGEIIPQAVCSRYGLAIGAQTIWFTKAFMFFTFPLSFPISKILDAILGEEVGNVYSRDRLRELLKITETDIDLAKDELNIITGALELSRKTVKDVMTKLEDVYMVDHNLILDFENVSEIMKTGYTRIPVYENEKTNIVALLNIKDLAFIDPDDRTPLKTVCKFYNHPINYVYDDTKLDVMLEEFKKGRSHLSFVQTVNNEGEGDPFYETLGVVTLEDVIEEIIQSEIIDETDTVTDNIKKAPRQAQTKDFSVLQKPAAAQNFPTLSPQLALATYQYMSTTVAPFKPELISEHVLQRLLKQNVVVNLTIKDPNSSAAMLYSQGKAVDYFVLILQGRIEVKVGRDAMIFEGGPFMYFGSAALTGHNSTLVKQMSVSSISSATDSIYYKGATYTPDFSVRALSDLQFLKIRRAHYIAARRATLMERQPKAQKMQPPEHLDDAFNKEWHRAISQQDNGSTLHLHDSKEGINSSPTADGELLPDRNRSETVNSINSDSVSVETPLVSPTRAGSDAV